MICTVRVHVRHGPYQKVAKKLCWRKVAKMDENLGKATKVDLYCTYLILNPSKLNVICFVAKCIFWCGANSRHPVCFFYICGTALKLWQCAKSAGIDFLTSRNFAKFGGAFRGRRRNVLQNIIAFLTTTKNYVECSKQFNRAFAQLQRLNYRYFVWTPFVSLSNLRLLEVTPKAG